MNLSQLRFVAAVAATGSFTAAASQCCVTQPTLSNGVARLEHELGARLFVRTTRKVALTAFGVHVLPCITDVLSARATLSLQAQAFLRPAQQLVRIGTSPLIGSNLMELMLEPFRRQNVGTEIVLREMNMADLYRMLDDGQLDFVFGVAGVHRAKRQTTPLYSEPLLFIPSGSETPRASTARSVRLKEIAGETFVMVPDACGLSRATRALFRTHRCALREYAGEAMSYQVLEQWAALGIGAAILPMSKLSAQARTAVAIVDKAGQGVSLAFEASWARDRAGSPHLQAFARHLRQVVPALVGGLESGPG